MPSSLELETKNIRHIYAELTQARKGRTRVDFNFERGLIRWSESTRWTRNFMRSFGLAEKEQLVAALQEQNFVLWSTHYPEPFVVEEQDDFRMLWHIRCEFSDGKVVESWGKDVQPPEYLRVVESIREICHQCFAVTD